MKFSTPQLQNMFLAGLAVLVLAQLPIYLIWIRPEMEVDNKAGLRLESIQFEVARQERVVKVLRDFDSRLKKSHQDFQEFAHQQLFTSERAGSQLLRDLEQTSQEAGLLRNRVSYKFDDKLLFGLQRIDFSIPIEGSYSSIRRFLNILERRPHFILVDSIAMESDREGQGGGIRMELNLSSFAFIDQ
jgi:Tfp pilus assembly protein PilO